MAFTRDAMGWLLSAMGRVPPPPGSGGPMTQQAARELVQWYVQSQGAVLSPGLNERGLGGLMRGEAQLYFEHHEDSGALECSALIYRFREPPRPGVLETFHKEEQEGTDTGGGTVDFEPDNGGLYLSRTYAQVPPARDFSRDMERLMKASLVWGEQVLDRVASRVFHPEELTSKS